MSMDTLRKNERRKAMETLAFRVASPASITSAQDIDLEWEVSRQQPAWHVWALV